ncbi:WD40 repeat domain-containing protein [Streptomyces sp. NPDC058108]|uniref:WD40 repeat domain-containing protein n=1 Tax=Streptomyces sp. NPDC058108 TaxID=3346344 RepID=UPI0036E721E6
MALWDASEGGDYLDRRAVDDPPGTPALITIVVSGVTHVAYASQSGEIVMCSAARVEYLSRWPDHDETDFASVPEEGRVLLTLPGGTTCLGASPTHILAGHRSGEVWSARLHGQPLPRLITHHTAPVHAVATVELDGQPHVISGDDVGAVQVTSFEAGLRHRLDGHTGAVFAITPVLLHGRPHVLTGGLDRSMRLWDVTSGRQFDVLWFPDTVFAIAVAQDGTVFAGVGPDVICLEPDARHLPLLPYTAPDRGHAIK